MVKKLGSSGSLTDNIHGKTQETKENWDNLAIVSPNHSPLRAPKMKGLRVGEKRRKGEKREETMKRRREGRRMSRGPCVGEREPPHWS